jgi:hypothetical protein
MGDGIDHPFSAYLHSPEFIEFENSVTPSGPVRFIKNRTPCFKLHSKGNDQEYREQNDKQRERHDHIQCTLYQMALLIDTV